MYARSAPIYTIIIYYLFSIRISRVPFLLKTREEEKINAIFRKVDDDEGLLGVN